MVLATIRLERTLVLGTPGAMILVSGSSRLARVRTVLLCSSWELEAVITIGLIMTRPVLQKCSCLVTAWTSGVEEITLTPMVLGQTLANMVLSRVVRNLGAALKTLAILAAPRVARVATVSTVKMLPVVTAPTLVRTLVLLSELSFVTANVAPTKQDSPLAILGARA